jgi:hypothetical protein
MVRDTWCNQMFSKTNAFVALAFAAIATVPAMGQDIEFELINNSSHTITYFYTAPSSTDNWGEDLLGDNGVMEPDTEANVFIGDGSDECLYDFRFESAEGGLLEVAEIDICELGSYTLTD